MRRPLCSVIVAVFLQLSAVGLGVGWDWLNWRGYWRLPDLVWHGCALPVYGLASLLSVVLLVVDGLCGLVACRFRRPFPPVSWLSLRLAGYAGLIIAFDPFFYCEDEATVIAAMVLLPPVLLAMGSLVRGGAWLGTAGAILFVATSVAIVHFNAVSWMGHIGFFSFWVA